MLYRDSTVVLTRLDEMDNMKICIFLFDADGLALVLYAIVCMALPRTCVRNAATGVSMKTGQGERDGDPSSHTNQVELKSEMSDSNSKATTT